MNLKPFPSSVTALPMLYAQLAALQPRFPPISPSGLTQTPSLAEYNFLAFQARIELQKRMLASLLDQKLSLPMDLNKSGLSITPQISLIDQFSNSKLSTFTDPKLSHKASLLNREKDFKTQVRDIVVFVVDNVGKISETAMEEVKNTLNDEPRLKKVFQALVDRYTVGIKTKENVIKYILRKALRYMKDAVLKENAMDHKLACAAFLDKYFPSIKEDLKHKGQNTDMDEEELFNSIMPFKKNSRNKTMNSNFLRELFSSKVFTDDYNKFIPSFDDMMFADNHIKIERFVTHILDCVDRNCYKNIGKFKRLPWLKSWCEKTKDTACGLVFYGNESSSEKKSNIKTPDDEDDVIRKMVKI